MTASSPATGFVGRYDPRSGRDQGRTETAHDAVDVEATLRRLRWLANFLDTAVRLPGGFRFGADTIIGLAPGIGDLATAGIACYFVWEGKRLGVPKHALAAMAGNVVLDLALGATPILGDLADTWFKANVRNLAIIEKYAAAGRLTPKS